MKYHPLNSPHIAYTELGTCNASLINPEMINVEMRCEKTNCCQSMRCIKVLRVRHDRLYIYEKSTICWFCLPFPLVLVPFEFLAVPKMTTNAAIVDDRDPLIQYAGTWNGAGSSSEFYSTTTWSPKQGSTASLSFVGTSVTVYGSVGPSKPPGSSLAFAVDDSVTGTYTAPSGMTTAIHHEALWTSPTLSSGSHTLIITQTTAQTSGVIFLDYIMYNTTSTSQPYFIDDRDSRITYTPAWVQEGSDEDFQHTCQKSLSAGDSFTLEFEGQSISFWGGNTSPTQNASVEIDGGSPTFFGAPTDATTTNNLLFHFDDLPAGKHTLAVTAQNGEPVWTDYFIVNPNIASLPSGSSASPISSSTPSSSKESTAPPSIASPKPTPTGAIVGGVKTAEESAPNSSYIKCLSTNTVRDLHDPCCGA
ncbi:hypothetical protein MVEN_01809800 [Mycena venus]|uniref:Uncharacterized protein n=1 Tax=Mycena venus TaxID=2733690 RepID=A0A8H7CLL1_9AGAR|nr:hypothetical protein MVEN_01809800 [Mycena venus]